VEEVEEEDVDAREHAHEAGLHDEKQQQVGLHPLRVGLDRVEARGEADEPGEDEERQRDPVEPELQADPERRRAPWSSS
jgi:hypothetical protein